MNEVEMKPPDVNLRPPHSSSHVCTPTQIPTGMPLHNAEGEENLAFPLIYIV